MEHWRDHPRGAFPLSYVAMLPYDTATGEWRDLPGTAAIAQPVLDAGAPVDGQPGDRETPLITAASYGDPHVARVLIAAGADVEAPADARLRAIVMAADHQRLGVIDQLVAAGTPVDATDEAFGGHPLRTAAGNGRPASVRRLLAHGADPNLRDDEGRTPLELC